MTKNLSVTRQADRDTMANLVVALAKRLGCSTTVSFGGTYPGPRCINVYVQAPGGLCVNVNFNGDSTQPNTYVLSWHLDLESSAKNVRLSPGHFGGNVNSHHFQKATYIAQGCEHLLLQLERGLQMAKDGTAYSTPEPALS